MSEFTFIRRSQVILGETDADLHQITGSLNLSGSLQAFDGFQLIDGNISMSIGATVDGVDVSEIALSMSIFENASASFAGDINELQVTASDHEIRITNEESTSSDHETRLDALEASSSTGLWTSSVDGYISRESDVQVTGSVLLSGNVEMTAGATVDGVDVSELSASVSVEINDLQFTQSQLVFTASNHEVRIDALEAAAAASGASYWTASDNGTISRNSDINVTGSIWLTGNVEMTSGATVDGVDVSELSSSVSIEINELQATASDYEVRISNNEVTLSQLVVTASDHEIRIGNEEATSSDHELRIDNAEVTLSQLVFTASDHEIRITNNEATLSLHETEINNLETTVSLHETEINNLQFTASDLVFTASDHETRLNALEAVSGTLWTGSVGGTISRESNVEITGNLDVSGVITAQEFHTELVSSSIIYESGSTKFGDDINDTHEFSGSLYVSGNVEMLPGATVDGVDVSELSSSVSIEINELQFTASNHETRISTNEGDITLLQATASDHEIRIDVLEGASASFSDRVESLEFTSSIQQFEINRLEQTASRLDYTASIHDNRLDALEADSASIAERLENEEATSSDHEIRIDNAEVTLSQLVFTASDHEARIILEEATSSDHEIRVGNAEVTLSQLVFTASDHETRIDALEAATSSATSYWTASIEGYISRESDIQVTGSISLSGNVEMVDLATVDGVDVSELSASFQNLSSSYSELSTSFAETASVAIYAHIYSTSSQVPATTGITVVDLPETSEIFGMGHTTSSVLDVLIDGVYIIQPHAVAAKTTGGSNRNLNFFMQINRAGGGFTAEPFTNAIANLKDPELKITLNTTHIITLQAGDKIRLMQQVDNTAGNPGLYFFPAVGGVPATPSTGLVVRRNGGDG